MSENKLDALIDKVKGTVKEGIGKLTGNSELEAEESLIKLKEQSMKH